MALRHNLVESRRNPHRSWDAEPEPEPGYIFVTLRVDSDNAVNARHNLHECLGNRIEIYTIEQDHHAGRSTFRIKLKSCSIDFLMHQIMETLPEAEFGQIINGYQGPFLQ